MVKRITKIHGHTGVWPITVPCDTCEIDFEVSSHKDLIKKRDYTPAPVPYAEPIPDKLRYYTSCPLCEQRIEVPEELIPEVLKKHMPLVQG